MTPAMQTIHGREGNCFQACLASLLDLPLQEVPNFYAGLHSGDAIPPEVEFHIWTWFKNRGLCVLDWAFAPDTMQDLLDGMAARIPGVHYLITGQSVRGTEHCVVCCNNRIVHDPAAAGGIVGPQCDGYYHIVVIGAFL